MLLTLFCFVSFLQQILKIVAFFHLKLSRILVFFHIFSSEFLLIHCVIIFKTVMGLLVVAIRPYTVKYTLFWLIYAANSSIGCNICFNSSYFSHFFTKVPVGSPVDCLFLSFFHQSSCWFAVISYFQTVMWLLVVSIRPFAVNSILFWLISAANS